MKTPQGVSNERNRPAPAIESVRGCSVNIENQRYLVVRRTTRTRADAEQADLGQSLVIDLDAADDSAGPALLAFLTQWCRSQAVARKSPRKGR